MSKAIPLPYSDESQYIVTQGFDTAPSHQTYLKWGVDFAMPYGSDVHAIIGGDIVAFRQNVEEEFIEGPASDESPAGAGSGHGNNVTVHSIVDGADVYVTYAHMAPHFLTDTLGIDLDEAEFSPGTSWGNVALGDVLGETGATGYRLTTRPESDGDGRGAHLHVHLGTDIVFFNTNAEWVADGSSDESLPVYFDAFGEDELGVAVGPTEWEQYAGSDFSVFEDANDGYLVPPNATSFADAIDLYGVVDGTDVAHVYLESVLGSAISNVSYTGSNDAAFLVNDFQIAGADIDLSGGILLSSGGYPGPVNTESGFSVSHGTAGDSDLNALATAAFAGAGTTYDAAVLEFDLFLDDPEVDGIRFDLVFGSDEYPEYSNSSYVDVAAVYVNGNNKALFNGDPSTPLSVIDKNLALNFVDNTGGAYPIEWDGFGAFSVRPALQQGTNHIKIAVADTGDRILDSAIYLTNFELLTEGATGDNPFKTVNGQVGQNDLGASGAQEEFNLASGNGSVSGSLDELNGDIITGFDALKTLFLIGVELLPEWIDILFGSAILQIDNNGDGTIESTITLEGDFSGAGFNVQQANGDTLITVALAANGSDGSDGDDGSPAVEQPAAHGIADVLATLVTPQQQENLTKLAVGMFGAAPGAVHLEDFAEYVALVGAASPGVDPILSLANALTGTPVFQSSQLFPAGMSDGDFATRFIDTLLGDAVADTAAVDWATAWLQNLLAAGLSRGDVIYHATAALDAVPHGDATWGDAARAFDNRVAVAEYYSVELGGNATGLSALQGILAQAGAETDVSGPAAVESFLASIGAAGLVGISAGGQDAAVA
jgi:hypothetical protein